MKSQERVEQRSGSSGLRSAMVGGGGGVKVENGGFWPVTENGGKPIVSRRKRDRVRALGRMR